ncbi:MAG: tripartite tricarboxylate transporter TctB family protein [Halopseudomonas sp.]
MTSSGTETKMNLRSQRDIGGMICATLFMLLGVACLYETTLMTDPDSYVFPRMVIAGLMGLSLVLIVNALVKPYTHVTEEAPSGSAPSNSRRILLVLSMLGATLLMPWVGFLLSGLGAFAALMLLAQYDPWTKGKVWLYSLVAVAIVCGFYGVFNYLLNVPLPEGSFIQFP